jgi:ferredoxin-NADP reductase
MRQAATEDKESSMRFAQTTGTVDKRPPTEQDAIALRRLPVDQRAFKGSDPRGRPELLDAAANDPLDESWRSAKAYDRRAVVTAKEQLTSTGTMSITLRAQDQHGLDFDPGQFVGIEANVAGARRRRTPFCILMRPEEPNSFTLLVRVVPQGPLSLHMAALRVGDQVRFRGPTGRSMIPKEDDTELVLLATGVGVSPFYALACRLLESDSDRRITLLWGLRLVEDICLLDRLDELAERHPNFSYRISLSQPEPSWTGLRGRLTETVPAEMGTLQGKHFYLCGNGAMIAELSGALVAAGADKRLIYEEAFFNARHRADPAIVARIRGSLVDDEVLSPVITGTGSLFPLDHPLKAEGAPGRVPASARDA